jgi:hypothetical protein
VQQRRRATGRAALASVALLAASAATGASEPGARGAAGALLQGTPPPAGHYDAVLYVAVGPRAADCGPVEVEVEAAGRTLMRLSDIVYRLELYGEQLGVSMFHGTMQVDGFFAPYRWSGPLLQFTDTEKATRYELKLGPRRFDLP